MSLSKLVVPVIASGLAVFGLSFVAHMVLPHHRNDCGKLQDESEILALIRRNNKPGHYHLPHVYDMESDPKSKELKEGLNGQVILRQGFCLSQALMQSLLYNIAVSALVGFIDQEATVVPQRRLLFLTVVTGGFYSIANGWKVIWVGEDPIVALKTVADSAVYGLATAACFVHLHNRFNL